MLPAMACRLFVHILHRHQPGVLNKEPDPASGRVRNTYPWPSAAGQGGNTYNSSPAFHRNCTSTTTLIGPPGPAIPQTIKAVRGSGQNSPGRCYPAAVMVADANIAPATLHLSHPSSVEAEERVDTNNLKRDFGAESPLSSKSRSAEG
jgi:hypothetical protein